MKNLWIVSIGGLFMALLVSCASDSSGDLPNDLTALRELQKEKRTQLRNIEHEIREIESKIDTLDTSSVSDIPMVTVDTLVKEDFDQFVEVQGRVVSQENVSASPEMAGIVTQLYVEEGQIVQKGALIATMDDASLRSQRQELQTQLELAKDVFERQKRLWEQNIGSELEYLQAKNRVESLEQSLETLNINIKKSNVYAPKSGVVDEIYIKQGMFAGPGAPILSIIDHKQLKVRLEVPENYLGKVSEGDSINIKFPTIGLKKKVKVSRIGSTINNNNRTFVAEAKIQTDEKGLIRPNMLAVGMVNNYHRDTVLQVPIDLVQQEVSGENYVFVKGMSEEGAVAVKKYVNIGKVAYGNAIIEEGLEEGQIILVAGARGLSANDRIRIQESSDNYPLEQ